MACPRSPWSSTPPAGEDSVFTYSFDSWPEQYNSYEDQSISRSAVPTTDGHGMGKSIVPSHSPSMLGMARRRAPSSANTLQTQQSARFPSQGSATPGSFVDTSTPVQTFSKIPLQTPALLRRPSQGNARGYSDVFTFQTPPSLGRTRQEYYSTSRRPDLFATPSFGGGVGASYIQTPRSFNTSVSENSSLQTLRSSRTLSPENTLQQTPRSFWALRQKMSSIQTSPRSAGYLWQETPILSNIAPTTPSSLGRTRQEYYSTSRRPDLFATPSFGGGVGASYIQTPRSVNTPLSENSSLQTLRSSRTLSPENTLQQTTRSAITLSPENTLLHTPRSARTLSPENTLLQTPRSARTLSPENTLLQTPQSARTLSPENTLLQTPQSARTLSPENTLQQTPRSARTLSPENTLLQTPRSARTLSPENTLQQTPLSVWAPLQKMSSIETPPRSAGYLPQQTPILSNIAPTTPSSSGRRPPLLTTPSFGARLGNSYLQTPRSVNKSLPESWSLQTIRSARMPSPGSSLLQPPRSARTPSQENSSLQSVCSGRMSVQESSSLQTPPSVRGPYFDSPVYMNIGQITSATLERHDYSTSRSPSLPTAPLASPPSVGQGRDESNFQRLPRSEVSLQESPLLQTLRPGVSLQESPLLQTPRSGVSLQGSPRLQTPRSARLPSQGGATRAESFIQGSSPLQTSTIIPSQQPAPHIGEQKAFERRIKIGAVDRPTEPPDTNRQLENVDINFPGTRRKIAITPYRLFPESLQKIVNSRSVPAKRHISADQRHNISGHREQDNTGYTEFINARKRLRKVKPPCCTLEKVILKSVENKMQYASTPKLGEVAFGIKSISPIPSYGERSQNDSIPFSPPAYNSASYLEEKTPTWSQNKHEQAFIDQSTGTSGNFSPGVVQRRQSHASVSNTSTGKHTRWPSPGRVVQSHQTDYRTPSPHSTHARTPIADHSRNIPPTIAQPLRSENINRSPSAISDYATNAGSLTSQNCSPTGFLSPRVDINDVHNLTFTTYNSFITQQDLAVVMFYDSTINKTGIQGDWIKQHVLQTPRGASQTYASVDCAIEPQLCAREAMVDLPFFRLYSKGFLINEVKDFANLDYGGLTK